MESPRHPLGKAEARLPREVGVLSQKKGPVAADGVAQEP